MISSEHCEISFPTMRSRHKWKPVLVSKMPEFSTKSTVRKVWNAHCVSKNYADAQNDLHHCTGRYCPSNRFLLTATSARERLMALKYAQTYS